MNERPAQRAGLSFTNNQMLDRPSGTGFA